MIFFKNMNLLKKLEKEDHQLSEKLKIKQLIKFMQLKK